MRFRLIPRDEGFYPLFEQQAQCVVETAVQLEELMTSLPVTAERVQTIIVAERAGDEVMRDIRSRLDTVDRHPVRPRRHPVPGELP